MDTMERPQSAQTCGVAPPATAAVSKATGQPGVHWEHPGAQEPWDTPESTEDIQGSTLQHSGTARWRGPPLVRSGSM